MGAAPDGAYECRLRGVRVDSISRLESIYNKDGAVAVTIRSVLFE